MLSALSVGFFSIVFDGFSSAIAKPACLQQKLNRVIVDEALKAGRVIPVPKKMRIDK